MDAKNKARKVIWVGDSRTVCMQMYVATEDPFLCKKSQGLMWITKVVNDKFDKLLKENPDAHVVLNFGINDIYNKEKYVSYYNSLPNKYPTNRFYFMSIHPVDEGLSSCWGYTIKNSQIEDFNETMRKSLKNVTYIDTYNYLNEIGFNMGDGIHIMPDTCNDIYNFVKKEIGIFP